MLKTEPSILDVIAAGLIVVARDRSIAHWNEWMVAASRRAAADVVGKPLQEVLTGERFALLHRAIDSALEVLLDDLIQRTAGSSAG